jgi:hypothetical protein
VAVSLQVVQLACTLNEYWTLLQAWIVLNAWVTNKQFSFDPVVCTGRKPKAYVILRRQFSTHRQKRWDTVSARVAMLSSCSSSRADVPTDRAAGEWHSQETQLHPNTWQSDTLRVRQGYFTVPTDTCYTRGDIPGKFYTSYEVFTVDSKCAPQLVSKCFFFAALCLCRWIPTFRKKLLPPCSGHVKLQPWKWCHYVLLKR